MTSFRFPETLCFRVKVRIRVGVRVSENIFKYVFGQTSIRVSVLEILSLVLDKGRVHCFLCRL